MKYRYLFLAALGLVAFLGSGRFSNLQENIAEPKDFEVIVKSSKDRFMTGENVNLILSLKNNSAESRTITNSFRVEAGYIAVYISKNEENFGKYLNPEWHRFDASWGNVTLKSNDSIEASVNILWNDKPKLSHLNALAAERFAKDKILTDYAFSESGTYFVKATFALFEKGVRHKIESEPIQIKIEEPAGEDLEVWKKIKDRADIAYFIQEGKFRTIEPEERRKLTQEVEWILSQHPTSIIAGQIGQSLQKLKISEENRKKSRENISKRLKSLAAV